MPDNIEDRSEIPSDAKEIVTTNEIEATDSEHTTNVDNELPQGESNEQTGDDSNDNLASKRQLTMIYYTMIILKKELNVTSSLKISYMNF